MPMNWSEERWVKLYVRDTTDWLSLPWQAQGLFALILRKVDRAGVLHLGKTGKRGICLQIGGMAAWPEIEPCLEALLDSGSVILEGDRIIVPNFKAAQEATQSAAARKRAQRERDAAEDQQGGREDGYIVSRAVTRGHSRTDQNRQDETEERDQKEDTAFAVPGPTGPASSPAEQFSMVIQQGSHADPPTAEGPASECTADAATPPAATSDTPADAASSNDPAQAGRHQDAKQPQTSFLAEETPKRALVLAVYETYVAEWRAAIKGARQPGLDDKRKRLIEARLKEFSVDDLKLACRGVWKSEFNVTNGHYSLDLIMRDRAHVERFIAFADPPSIRLTSSEDIAWICERWAKARQKAGKPAVLDPDPRDLQAFWTACLNAAKRAADEAKGRWSPTPRQVAAFWIRSYLLEKQAWAGGVEDRSYPFSGLRSPDRLNAFGLPKRSDVEGPQPANAPSQRQNTAAPPPASARAAAPEERREAPPAPAPAPARREAKAPVIDQSNLANLKALVGAFAAPANATDRAAPSRPGSTPPPAPQATSSEGEAA